MALHTIVLAGGQGKRFRSSQPKIVHPILGRAMMLWPLQAAFDAGADQATIVVSPGIVDHAKTLTDNRTSIAVQEVSNGTGGAVIAAINDVDNNDNVLVVCGDTPLLTSNTLADLVKHHTETQAVATVLSTKLDDAGSYGRIVRENDRPIAIVEAKDASTEQLAIQEINTGVWVFQAAWLKKALPQLSSDNAQGELYLTDVLAIAVQQQGAQAFCTEDATACWGVNDRVQQREAAEVLQMRVLQQLEQGGCSLVGHGHYIEPSVTIGQDVTIAGPTTIRGTTTIGNNVEIDTGCVFDNAQIAAQSTIKSYTVIEEAVIGENAIIGPFARLRPGTKLGANTKVGNFVETKKTIVGDGAKINHLSYIGDATVGAKANVGAGTITCNYDGTNKYQTTIGPNAFIGSNTSLVAPVAIGENAITGAGSVVTQDVEANALVVERAQSRVVPNYATRTKSNKGSAS